MNFSTSFIINGERRDIELTDPRVTLLDLLRERLNLTGTKKGCDRGQCGACTVLVDGQPARSCLLLAVQAEGTEVTTIEGLAGGDEPHPIQQAMCEAHGFQCGFCTPGFLMSAVALVAENPAPTRDQIREELSGNLCRCTGYQSIIDGVEIAVRLLADGAVT
jgi:aerobic-type carbon monoxide dehydrogenase small subunit (CoxS/CutS family)